ncbi:hypothetical protein [Magnetospirillum sulfuroxidans]|uniref:Transcriptional regulator n=1 Tax=Magnetospirillum sulfuroxidans TaxID=611300 RepID=A0ABS5I9L1_9PROT|nr:hypothetical protein [Magnetospirillum sulfuroxidans]MBR9970842.1 hypothetical protein [Magnetospirillum sulfuroxidans]
MQMIEHSLRREQLREIEEAMRERGEALSYPEMMESRDQVEASANGNRKQRRKAKAMARKVPA